MTVYGSAFVHVKKNTNFGCGIKDSSQTFTQEDLRSMKYYIRIDEEVKLYQYEIFGEYVSIDYIPGVILSYPSWAAGRLLLMNELLVLMGKWATYKKTSLFGLWYTDYLRVTTPSCRGVYHPGRNSSPPPQFS